MWPGVSAGSTVKRNLPGQIPQTWKVKSAESIFSAIQPGRFYIAERGLGKIYIMRNLAEIPYLNTAIGRIYIEHKLTGQILHCREGSWQNIY